MKSEVRVYIDGACSGNPGPAGCGVWISDSSSDLKLSVYIGEATNNIAEYLALFIALEELKDKTDCAIKVYSDSELVIKQIKGEYKIRNPKLREIFSTVSRKLSLFENISLEHISRDENKIADKLARRAIDLSRLVGQGGRAAFQ